MQRKQLQEDELQKNRVLHKNNDTLKKKMDVGMNAVGKHSSGGNLSEVDFKAIITCVLPLSVSKEAPSYSTNITKVNERLAKLPQHCSKYFEGNLSDMSVSVNINAEEAEYEIIMDEMI